MIRALVWRVSVTIPACEPVSEIARCPRSLIAIAHSAHEIRSPVESSMSISRGSGLGETSSAIAISSSVVWPRADSTATTRLPASRLPTIRRAARLIRSASATEVPPNFITMVSGIGGRVRARPLTEQRGGPVASDLPALLHDASPAAEPNPMVGGNRAQELRAVEHPTGL